MARGNDRKKDRYNKRAIFEENPDVIINIVDATSIERSLYLTTQLMELDTKLIIALNMADILEKKGLVIDEKKLEKELGVKVYKISALKETGIDKLVAEIDKKRDFIRKEVLDSKIETEIKIVQADINRKHSKFIAVKLLEDDVRFKEYKTNEVINRIKKLEANYDTDLEEVIATQRYDFIEKVKNATVIHKKVAESISENK